MSGHPEQLAELVRKILASDVELSGKEVKKLLSSDNQGTRRVECESTIRRVDRSRDLPGFSAAGKTFHEVRQIAQEGVRFSTNTQPEIVEDNTPSQDPGDWRQLTADSRV